MFSWLDIGNNTWIAQVFLVVFVTVVLNLIMRVVLRKAHEKLELTENVWDDAVLMAAHKPLALFVWVIGLSIAAEIAQNVTENELFQFIPLIRRIAIILLLMMFLNKLIKNIEQNILHKTKKSEIEKALTSETEYAKLQEFASEINKVNKDLESKEMRWLELSERA